MRALPRSRYAMRAMCLAPRCSANVCLSAPRRFGDCMRAAYSMLTWTIVLTVCVSSVRHVVAQTQFTRESQWRAVLNESAPSPKEAAARESLARRQAQAAINLYRLGHVDAVWPLLRHEPDPTRRSFLIRDVGRSGAVAEPIVRRLTTETDASALRALVLMLGEFDATAIDSHLRVRASEPAPGAISHRRRSRRPFGRRLAVATRTPGPERAKTRLGPSWRARGSRPRVGSEPSVAVSWLADRRRGPHVGPRQGTGRVHDGLSRLRDLPAEGA